MTSNVGDFLRQVELYGKVGHESFALVKEQGSGVYNLTTIPKYNSEYLEFLKPVTHRHSIIRNHIHKYIIDHAEEILKQTSEVSIGKLIQLQTFLTTPETEESGKVVKRLLDQRAQLQDITTQVATEILNLQNLQNQTQLFKGQLHQLQGQISDEKLQLQQALDARKDVMEIIQCRDKEIKQIKFIKDYEQNAQQPNRGPIPAISEISAEKALLLRNQPNANVRFNCKGGDVLAHMEILQESCLYFQALSETSPDEGNIYAVDWTKFSQKAVSDLVDIIYGIKSVAYMPLKELEELFLLTDYIGLEKIHSDCQLALKTLLCHDMQAYSSLWPTNSTLLNPRLEKFYLQLLSERYFESHIPDYLSQNFNFFRYLQNASKLYPTDLDLKVAIGLCLYYRKSDKERGHSLILEAAIKGNPWAQVELSHITKIKEDRLLWAEKSAAQGFAAGEYHSSKLLRYTNDIKRLEYLRKAVDKNHSVATYDLGHLYEMGYGVDKDEAKALELYKRAVALGDNFAHKYIIDLTIKMARN